MRRRINPPTLRQVFLLTIAGLAVLLAVLFYVLMDGSKKSILQSSDRLRDEAARRIADNFRAYLESAEKALADIEGQLRYANLSVDDPAALERALFAEVRNSPRLAEVTLTHAETLEYAPNGQLAVAGGARWQLSAYRVLTGVERIVTRRVFMEGDHFVAERRDHPPDVGLLDVPLVRPGGTVPDPTEHLTFRTLVARRFYGDPLWSDLQWSQFEAAPATAPSSRPATVPAGQRDRAQVTVQKAVEDRAGRFLGVLRIGLLTEQLDEVCGLNRPRGGVAASTGGADDPHRVFVCDSSGRLVTRVAPDDRLVESNDDLRFVSPHAPAEVAAALRLPVLESMRPGMTVPAAVDVEGRRYLVTFRALDNTQDWIISVIAPEDYYLRGLTGTRDRLLLASLAVMAVILLGGALVLRVVQRGLSRAAASAARMQDFDFSPSDVTAPFRDVRATIESLERAKTAMRAMGKYVPVNLVRRLYQMNQEPALGGDLMDVTLLFTDIGGFTAVAEKLAPDDLALLLGEYFAALTAAVHTNQGIVDKFIGDAVMALWNVPTPVADHPRQACAAALDCLTATRRLNESTAARGLPALTTRVGLHRDTVMVGHFGAPDRLSYTVLGDGVNLASRLEGLNKQYGTQILVSEAVREAAGADFRFRLLDRVVVVGKTRGVQIYELRGRAADKDPTPALVARYEGALAAYWRREFAAAEALAAGQAEADPPSRVLAERCRLLAADPPPPNWDGTYIALEK